MKIVDTCGRLCPEPLILTRRAMADANVGDAFEIISDNAMAKSNLMNFLSEMGVDATCSERGGLYFLNFILGQSIEKSVSAESFCSVSHSGAVVVLKSDVMGVGDDKLGLLLMRAFLNSILELDVLPSVVVAYNGGVRLCVQGSDSAAALGKLKERGVRIVACGTCVDFFDIKDDVVVAEIGNMLLISELTMGASSVVYP